MEGPEHEAMSAEMKMGWHDGVMSCIFVVYIMQSFLRRRYIFDKHVDKTVLREFVFVIGCAVVRVQSAC